jgi:hypothetical protein
MDQTTQQNAALVEQMAAAASSLKSQAQELVATVATFKVDGSQQVARTTVRSSTPQSVPFKGEERRNPPKLSTKSAPASPSARPAAAKPVALSKAAAAPAPRFAPAATPKAPQPAAPKAAPKVQIAAPPPANAADEEWETF